MQFLFKRAVILLVGIVFCLSMIRTVQSLMKNYKRSSELEARKVVLRESEEKNKKLQNTLQELQSKEYVEKIAREKLGLIREGEYVILMPTPQLAATPTPLPTPIDNWTAWKERLF